MQSFTIAVFTLISIPPVMAYNPCGYESLLSVEGPATGSCVWTFRKESEAVQTACQTGARHMVSIRIPNSEKGKKPCSIEAVELAEILQRYACDSMFAGPSKEGEACKVGVDKVVAKLKKRIKAQ